MDGPGGWRRPSRSVMTKMMKESVKTGHPTGLPDKLLRLFAPNEPMRYIKENCKPKKPPAVPWSGIGAYVSQFASPGDAEYEPKVADFPEPRLYNNKEYDVQVRLDEETKLEKEKRLREWKQEKAKQDLEDKVSKFDPNNDPVVEGDPYKTLFVSRLSYDVTERKLRHEFEEYGPIKRIRLVHTIDSDKPRGYAFIEYEHKKDMKEAYKQSDGRKIEGRRILVDVERGRTVENWRPMRLGGGLGGDSHLPKEPRKKILAEAAARGVAAPPSADDRGIRYSTKVWGMVLTTAVLVWPQESCHRKASYSSAAAHRFTRVSCAVCCSWCTCWQQGSSSGSAFSVLACACASKEAQLPCIGVPRVETNGGRYKARVWGAPGQGWQGWQML